MLYEGRRYWPRPLWHFYLNKESEILKSCTEKQEKAYEAFLKTNNLDDEQIYLEMSVERRQFPIDENTGERVSKAPTRLGNILKMYETYPDVMYGLDGVFFWYRLWLFLNKDVREDFETQQAYADSTVYTSAALFISGFIVLSYPFAAIFKLTPLDQWPFYVWFVISFVLLFMGYIVYRMSLHLHVQFGETWKSIFDVYRAKLVDIQIDEDIAVWTGEENVMAGKTPREKNKIIWSYLQYYKIWCEEKGRSFEAPQYSQGCNRVEKDGDQA
jgi:hypothetical protein